MRDSIVPGNSSSLWKAVSVAKDVNYNQLPKTLFTNNVKISEGKTADAFASHFDKKIRDIVDSTIVEEDVYNGTMKVNSETKNFMRRHHIMECLLSLKCKNSEGFDRIPQRILKDGAEILIGPLTDLFDKIYSQRSIPSQWLVAKTIPVYKNKGDKKDIESYRPIANLCSTSKLFEKLILKRILEIEATNNVDLTGINQHGFKKKRSTSTLSNHLQSIIGRALDEDNFVLVPSLDLSSAFDVVNVDLLIKRLQLIGMPSDIIEMITIWLKDRTYFVSIDGNNSLLFDLFSGTVQGSILGPVLYALFVSPVFDIEFLLAFADDNFIPRINCSKIGVIEDMKRSLGNITKWLKKSGLKVNSAKTEMCLFHKNDTTPISIVLGDDEVTSSKQINVLGVTFDSKLNWTSHIHNTVAKCAKSLNALKIIRKHFTTKEFLMLLTSNFYSIMYYNCEIWMIHSLSVANKKLLLSTSANALKVAYNYRFPFISFKAIHSLAGRATPSMITNYKLALMLHVIYNCTNHSDEWTHLNLNQVFTSRQTCFHINRHNNLTVGMNALSSRLYFINDKIPFELLNKSFESYKIECKRLFLN